MAASKLGIKPLTAFKGFFSLQASQSEATAQKRKSQEIAEGGSLPLPPSKKPAVPQLATQPTLNEEGKQYEPYVF